MPAIVESVFISPRKSQIILPMRSPRVVKPLVGISCCTKQFGIFGMPNHAASNTYVEVSDQLVHAVPVLIPANGPTADIETLLEHVDGIMLTGSRSNVHPSYYDGPPHAEGTWEDMARDSTTLPLIRAAVARGVPVLAICRGFQELNVALGGSLHQRLQDLPDRIDHSSPMIASREVRSGKAHAIRVTPGGWLHRLSGASEIAVNSLHNQGVNKLAPGVRVEGTAPDGTIEAVHVLATAAGPVPGFAVGIQWHPENDWRTDIVSQRIFDDFAAAVHAYAEDGRMGGMSAAAD
jgi:putative glutamine amidotransferase